MGIMGQNQGIRETSFESKIGLSLNCGVKFASDFV